VADRKAATKAKTASTMPPFEMPSCSTDSLDGHDALDPCLAPVFPADGQLDVEAEVDAWVQSVLM
jgi:hypothetical protein